MNHIERLIEQAKAAMACPACGRHFASNEISCKGFMEHTYILQTRCSNNHPTLYTTWITSYVPTAVNEATPLETDDLVALHQQLQGFDGNFKALWSNER